jgi:hypothetical protein
MFILVWENYYHLDPEMDDEPYFYGPREVSFFALLWVLIDPIDSTIILQCFLIKMVHLVYLVNQLSYQQILLYKE